MLGAAEGGPEQGTSSCIELFLVTVLRSQVSLQGYREDRSNCGSEKGEEKAPMPVRIWNYAGPRCCKSALSADEFCEQVLQTSEMEK